MLTSDEIEQGYREGIIYLFVCLCNLKVYVGQTVCEEKRYNSHRLALDKDSVLFHRAIKKYGFDKFSYKVLFSRKYKKSNEKEIEYIHNELDRLEDYYIEFFNARNPIFGYNICKGGQHKKSGFKLLEETKNLISNKLKNRILTKEHKKNIGLAHKGRKFTEEHKENLKKSKEEKKKLDPNYGKSSLAKRILLLNLEGIILGSFESFSDAERKTGINKVTISKHCKGIPFRKDANCDGTHVDKEERVWIFEEDLNKLTFPLENPHTIPGNSLNIVQVSLNNEFLKEFPTIKEAANSIAKELSLSSSSVYELIIKVCKHKKDKGGKEYLSAYGYRWFLKNEWDKIKDKLTPIIKDESHFVGEKSV